MRTRGRTSIPTTLGCHDQDLAAGRNRRKALVETECFRLRDDRTEKKLQKRWGKRKGYKEIIKVDLELAERT